GDADGRVGTAGTHSRESPAGGGQWRGQRHHLRDRFAGRNHLNRRRGRASANRIRTAVRFVGIAPYVSLNINEKMLYDKEVEILCRQQRAGKARKRNQAWLRRESSS